MYVGCYADVNPWKIEIVWAHVVWFITCAWSNWINYLNVLPNVQMNGPSEMFEKYTDKTNWRFAMCFSPFVLECLLMFQERLQNLNFTSMKTEINKHKKRQNGLKGNAWGLAHQPSFLYCCILISCQWWKLFLSSFTPLMLSYTQCVLPETHRWQINITLLLYIRNDEVECLFLPPKKNQTH